MLVAVDKLLHLTLYCTIPTFNDSKEEGLGKHWEKKKMLITSIFLHFPIRFSTLSKELLLFQQHLSSANAFNLVMSKNLSFGKELVVTKLL